MKFNDAIFILPIIIPIIIFSCEDDENKTDINEYINYISGCTKLAEEENNILINQIVYFEDDHSGGSTGYSWHYTISNELVLKYLEEKTFCFEHCDDGTAGNPIREVIKFKAIDIGTANLNLKYYREWLGEETAIEDIDYVLNVTNDK